MVSLLRRIRKREIKGCFGDALREFLAEGSPDTCEESTSRECRESWCHAGRIAACLGARAETVLRGHKVGRRAGSTGHCVGLGTVVRKKAV